MKLQQSTFKSQTLGVEKEMSFSIESENSIIFDILRDKMYSNKIAAVCREVSSNSRDANREAGKKDTPIDIIIAEPNEYIGISDMAIVFRDYGTGITPDRMENIFLKYGASTKRDTNKQTGGFGLGAKTPFAYNDTFTVITVCEEDGEKTKYVYNAMIDSSRKGQMVLFDSEETDEPTGTRIIVPIAEDDRYQFEKECFKATVMWPLRPNYINFYEYVPSIDIESEKKDLMLFNCDASYITSQKYNLIIDGIIYPITDMSVVGDDYPESFVGNVGIKFNNGDLTIAANRETVQYDEQTVRKIAKKLKALETFFISQIEEYFDGLEGVSFLYANEAHSQFKKCINISWYTPDQSVLRLAENLGRMNDDMGDYIKMRWYKLQKKFGMRFKNEPFENLRFKSCKHPYSKNHWKGSYSHSISANPDSIVYIIIEKGTKITPSKTRGCYAKYEGKEIRFVSQVAKPDTDGLINEMNVIMEQTNNIEMYSDIEPVRENRANVQRSSRNIADSDKDINVRIAQFNGADKGYFVFKADYQMVDLGRYRLDRIAFCPVKRLGDWDNGECEEIDRKIDLLSELCSIVTIIVKERDWDKYFQNHNYPTLDEVWEEKKGELKMRGLQSLKYSALNRLNDCAYYYAAKLIDPLALPEDWRNLDNIKQPDHMHFGYFKCEDDYRKMFSEKRYACNYSTHRQWRDKVQETHPLLYSAVAGAGLWDLKVVYENTAASDLSEKQAYIFINTLKKLQKTNTEGRSVRSMSRKRR